MERSPRVRGRSGTRGRGDVSTSPPRQGRRNQSPRAEGDMLSRPPPTPPLLCRPRSPGRTRSPAIRHRAPTPPGAPGGMGHPANLKRTTNWNERRYKPWCRKRVKGRSKTASGNHWAFPRAGMTEPSHERANLLLFARCVTNSSSARLYVWGRRQVAAARTPPARGNSPKKGRRNGGALYNDDTWPGGVAEQDDLGNLG